MTNPSYRFDCCWCKAVDAARRPRLIPRRSTAREVKRLGIRSVAFLSVPKFASQSCRQLAFERIRKTGPFPAVLYLSSVG